MITSKDTSFFQVARNVSKLANWNNKKCQIGCVIVDKHRIISSGFNQDKTSPIQKKYNKERFTEDTPHSLHAEVHALASLVKNKDINFSKIQIYTYREKKNGQIGCSRPCRSCMKLIKDLGIRYIYYTTDDGFAEEKLEY